MGLEHARQYGWQDTYVFTKAMGEMLVGEVAKVRVKKVRVLGFWARAPGVPWMMW
jgi:hypothetical protein